MHIVSEYVIQTAEAWMDSSSCMEWGARAATVELSFIHWKEQNLGETPSIFK